MKDLVPPDRPVSFWVIVVTAILTALPFFTAVGFVAIAAWGRQ